MSPSTPEQKNCKINSNPQIQSCIFILLLIEYFLVNLFVDIDNLATIIFQKAYAALVHSVPALRFVEHRAKRCEKQVALQFAHDYGSGRKKNECKYKCADNKMNVL